MRNCGKLLCAFLLMDATGLAFAGGYEPPPAAVRAEVRAPVQPMVRTVPVPFLQATVYPGSLKKNIEHIAGKYGWAQVVWNVPNDYQWVGQTTIRANDVPGLLTQLLKNYPVQAVFYKGNHILAISQRTLR